VILRGDCVERMRELDEASVDAICTDPPYELGFMNRAWDRSGVAYRVETWREALRILKPGGHLLAFGGTRTYHRLACAVEDAGFEIRDSLIWLYGSGFPKSLDVSKAIDKANGRRFDDRYVLGRHIRKRREAAGLTRAEVNAWFDYRDGCEHWERQDPSGARVPTLADWGVLSERLDLSPEFLPLVERVEAERQKVGRNERPAGWFTGQDGHDLTAPATPEAQQWQGWGTALKPAHEPIVVARKPLSGTVAQTVLEYGTGALNIDGCRVGVANGDEPSAGHRTATFGTQETQSGGDGSGDWEYEGKGRWPPNLALSHLPECERVGTRRVKGSAPASGPTLHATESVAHGDYTGERVAVPAYQDQEVAAYECAPGCPIAELDRQSGERPAGTAVRHRSGGNTFGGESEKPPMEDMGYGDTGGASRFFYTAKSSRAERNAGLDGFEEKSFEDHNMLASAERIHPDGRRHVNKPAPPRANAHPTVKPIDLMRWLVRLVTPPGGTVLDPFMGSGTTGIAAHLEGFDFIGIEREAEYADIAEARIAWWSQFPAGTATDAALGVEAVERKVKESGQGSLLEDVA
jgi:DNA modification methylase